MTENNTQTPSADVLAAAKAAVKGEKTFAPASLLTGSPLTAAIASTQPDVDVAAVANALPEAHTLATGALRKLPTPSVTKPGSNYLA